MQLSRPGLSLPYLLEFYGVFFGLGWVSPDPRSLGQRILYIVVGLGTAIAARCFGIDLGLFIFFYFAKCYFLLNRRTAIALCLLTIIPDRQRIFCRVGTNWIATGRHPRPARDALGNVSNLYCRQHFSVYVLRDGVR
jgi:hypothetical protein